ncbi:hypothetical protein WN982_04275 [Paraburkholderia sp. IMGN_8]|uniref:hypothetical protein n=1 Tax=Paraburkholderia sp. IMGN_8 TaxID=3136564 RepID=UPI003101A78B
MLFPTRKSFERYSSDGLTYFSTGLHPNPRLFKYLWQIWTPDSPLEGEEFLRSGPLLSTGKFVEIEQQMLQARKSGFVYNRCRVRMGLGSPFNLDHPRWKVTEWAPSWDDDPDPVWNGYK